jgi:transposase
MKRKDVIFERKEFLNLPGHNGMANIVAQIVGNNYKSDGEEYRSAYCKLDFADCSRVISMDIDLDDEYNRENALFKIDTLIDVLTEYRDVVEKEAKYQKRLERKRERIKAEKKAKEKE